MVGNVYSSAASNGGSMSDKSLAQRQKEVMKLQDDMLLDIESGVGRLHDKVSTHQIITDS